MIVGGGVLDAPQVSSLSRVICRAASPLAVAAVCGIEKVCGRDESLPYRLNRERDLAASCGPGMPGPYRAAMGKPSYDGRLAGRMYAAPTNGRKFYGCGGSGEPPTQKWRKVWWR